MDEQILTEMLTIILVKVHHHMPLNTLMDLWYLWSWTQIRSLTVMIDSDHHLIEDLVLTEETFSLSFRLVVSTTEAHWPLISINATRVNHSMSFLSLRNALSLHQSSQSLFRSSNPTKESRTNTENAWRKLTQQQNWTWLKCQKIHWNVQIHLEQNSNKNKIN